MDSGPEKGKAVYFHNFERKSLVTFNSRYHDLALRLKKDKNL
jgi:hypothetical protein